MQVRNKRIGLLFHPIVNSLMLPNHEANIQDHVAYG